MAWPRSLGTLVFTTGYPVGCAILLLPGFDPQHLPQKLLVWLLGGFIPLQGPAGNFTIRCLWQMEEEGMFFNPAPRNAYFPQLQIIIWLCVGPVHLGQVFGVHPEWEEADQTWRTRQHCVFHSGFEEVFSLSVFVPHIILYYPILLT